MHIHGHSLHCPSPGYEVSESYFIRLTGRRMENGYGLTASASEKIIELKPHLGIAADAGISDGERVEKLSDARIDVIITDHHLVPRGGVPGAAVAVVNPQQENCTMIIRSPGAVWPGF